MDPSVKNGGLLYASDGSTNDVNIYTYPKLKLVGTLTGFSGPQGICLNQAGDVWIVNAGASDVLEYAPLGTSPIATLHDPGQYSIACSGDDEPGNLAVSNILSTSDGPGSLSIYKHAEGNPDVIEALTRDYFVTYDSKGNLFIDGQNPSYAFALGEIPKGSKKVEPLSVSGATIDFPGGVQYADGNLALGDQANNVIYQLAVSGSVATVVGTTKLLGSSDVVTFFIHGHVVLCLDAGNADIEIYKYPAGGEPIKVIHNIAADGLVITKKT
jgi:hypothetical protein